MDTTDWLFVLGIGSVATIGIIYYVNSIWPWYIPKPGERPWWCFWCAQ